MRLITGPPASGKTELVLERFRSRVGAGDWSVRLLVPTTTMAQHLQNRLAREGLVFRTGLVQTLSRFIDSLVEDVPQASEAVLYLLVEKAVARANRPEFARVANLPGLWASIAQTILEFSSAGCDSERLARSLPPAPLSDAFLAVYREVDRELALRGLALRARRLEAAASRIRERGTGGVETIWLDGFHALPEPELDVIEALAGKADVTLALTAANVTDRIRKLCTGQEQTAHPRPHPAVAVVPAPSIEREVEEIARRIVGQAASRPFRQIGIIVRQPERYVPILRSTLERFGIPARFYFDSGLAQHPVIRLLTGAVDAMLGGWDHEQVLAALRLAPRWADSDAVDRFDFDVRKQIPNQGLGALKSLLLGRDGAWLPGADKLMHKLDALAGLEELRSLALSPADWAARLLTLRSLFRPARPAEAANHETALLWRSQAEALNLFEEALREAVLVQEPDRILGLEEFWPAVKSLLRLKVMRLPDPRRNVVQVLTAHEARQWLLPVVFVCGLVEKQFPQFHPQSAFFDESARVALNASGIALRTAADFEREEEALFDSALARSTVLATLSYPEFDARGDANLPSLFLGKVMAPVEPARTVRPRPRSVAGVRPPAPITHPLLLGVLRERSARLRPTGLETYLQCPFQYFAQRTLKLKEPPPRPAERLDFMTQGNIVHEVLKEWWQDPRPIEPVFESVFARAAAEKFIPECYHTERLRNAMLLDLRAFAAAGDWPRARFQSRVEERFELPLEDGVVIAGQIDRLDVAGGRAWVVDYKYSGAQRTKGRQNDANLLQAPLYLLAAERCFGFEPAGMYYIGLKGGVLYVGWGDAESHGLPRSEPVPANWLPATVDTVRRILGEVRAGRVEPAPSDPAACRYCDFRDVCRMDARQAEAVGETA